MEVLLSCHDLSKAFSTRPLFKNLNFGIHRGDRISLVGPNGAGKSTLLKILNGLEKADHGRVVLAQGLRLAYLEQNPVFPKGQTLFECALEKAQNADEWETQSRAHEWISKAGFLEAGFDESTPVESLSGGWKKRAGLMREMMREPDLLFLDEPTNHLDLESVLWLEEILERARCAYLVVTHDRKFMQRISEKIFDLDRRYPEGILKVEGTLSDYLYYREQELESQRKLEQKMKNTLRFEYAWLLKEPKARTTKSKSRIERTEDLMKDVDEITNRNKRAAADIKFVALQGGTQKLIELKNITKSYGDRTVLKNVDLLVTAKSRIGLLGKNGSGKSTLIKVLLGQEGVDSGEVRRADHLKVIYFSQEREKFSPNETPRTVLCPQGEYVQFGGKFVHVNGYLERFLLGGDMAMTPLRKLSGGEQNRLHLARLMLGEGNLLVLDEPTNDLDLETLHVLEEALEEFSGGLILVTHDRLFLNRLSNEILYVNDAGLERFADVLQWEDYYLEKKQKLFSRDSAKAEKTIAVDSHSVVKGVSAQSAAPVVNDSSDARPKQKLSYKFARELETMEENISKAEAELADLTAKFEASDGLNSKEISELSQKLAAAQHRVDTLYARWDELLKMQAGE